MPGLERRSIAFDDGNAARRRRARGLCAGAGPGAGEPALGGARGGGGQPAGAGSVWPAWRLLLRLLPQTASPSLLTYGQRCQSSPLLCSSSTDTSSGQSETRTLGSLEAVLVGRRTGEGIVEEASARPRAPLLPPIGRAGAHATCRTVLDLPVYACGWSLALASTCSPARCGRPPLLAGWSCSSAYCQGGARARGRPPPEGSLERGQEGRRAARLAVCCCLSVPASSNSC